MPRHRPLARLWVLAVAALAQALNDPPPHYYLEANPLDGGRLGQSFGAVASFQSLATVYGLRLVTKPTDPPDLRGFRSDITALLNLNADCPACTADTSNPSLDAAAWDALPIVVIPISALFCQKPYPGALEARMGTLSAPYGPNRTLHDAMQEMMTQDPAWFLEGQTATVEWMRLQKEAHPNGARFQTRNKKQCHFISHASPAAQALRARWEAGAQPLSGAARDASSSAPRTLRVAVHVRRGDVPKWRHIPMAFYADSLAQVHAHTSRSAAFHNKMDVVFFSDATEAQLREELDPLVKEGRLPEGFAWSVRGRLSKNDQHTNGLLTAEDYVADDFRHLAGADVLLTSHSSFAYFAALFSRGVVVTVDYRFPMAHLQCSVSATWGLPAFANGKFSEASGKELAADAAWAWPASPPFDGRRFGKAFKLLEAGACGSVVGGTGEVVLPQPRQLGTGSKPEAAAAAKPSGASPTAEPSGAGMCGLTPFGPAWAECGLDGSEGFATLASTRLSALPAAFPTTDAAEVGDANRAIDWLSDAQLARSCVGTGGDNAAWTRVVRKAAAARAELRATGAVREGSAVRVLAVGGSVTKGTNCGGDATKSEECAWPNRLQHHLDRAYGEGAAVVRVAAYSATTSTVALTHSAFQKLADETDLLIMDYSVNDAIWPTRDTYNVTDPTLLPEAATVQASTAKLATMYQSKGSAVVALAAFYVPISEASWTHWMKDRASGASSAAPIFQFVGWAGPEELALGRRLHYAYQDVIMPVAEALDFSVVSYRDAFFPDVSHPPHYAYWSNMRPGVGSQCARFGGPFRQDPHPSFEDHQLMADLLWHHWAQHSVLVHCEAAARAPAGGAAAALGGGDAQDFIDAAGDDGCAQTVEPTLYVDADEDPTGELRFRAEAAGAGWRFYADRPGKPGWIGAARAGAADDARTAVWSLPCADGPVRAEFLRSYASVGKALVAVSPPVGLGAPAPPSSGWAQSELEGRWDKGVSLYETKVLPVPEGTACASDGTDRRLVRVRLPEGQGEALKVKLTGLQACRLRRGG